MMNEEYLRMVVEDNRIFSKMFAALKKGESFCLVAGFDSKLHAKGLINFPSKLKFKPLAPTTPRIFKIINNRSIYLFHKVSKIKF